MLASNQLRCLEGFMSNLLTLSNCNNMDNKEHAWGNVCVLKP